MQHNGAQHDAATTLEEVQGLGVDAPTGRGAERTSRYKVHPPPPLLGLPVVSNKHEQLSIENQSF